MTRDEIVKYSGIPTGGDLSRYLNELEWCGFIRKYTIMGKHSRDAIYQLIDNFTLFHFQYIQGNKNNDSHFWTNNFGSPYIEHGVDSLLNVFAFSISLR